MVPFPTLPVLHVHVKENGIVVRGGARAARPKDAREGRHVGGLRLRALLEVVGPTARDDAKGAEGRVVFRQERGHPRAVVEALLQNPIAAGDGVFVEVNAHAALLVAVLDDDRGGRFQKGRHGHAALIALFEEGPLVFHLVVDGHVVEEGVQAHHVAIVPPVAEPVVGGQQTGCVFLGNGGLAARREPLVHGRHQTDGGIRRQ